MEDIMTTMMTLKRAKSEISLLGVVLLVFLILPNFSHALFGGKIESFTADQVGLSPQGKVTNSVKIYVSPKICRMDGMPGVRQSPRMSKNLSIFSFKEKQEEYIFNHDKKIYYQTDMDDKAMLLEMKNYKDAEEVKVLGKEKVSGYNCVKKQVTTTTTIYGMTSTNTVIIWESDRFQMPLRTKVSEGYVMEIRNIKKGTPDKKYFKMPQGYKKVGNMMTVMGMDMGRMGGLDDLKDEPVPATAGEPSKKRTGSTKTSPQAPPNDVEKVIQSLGNKLKNFRFGK